MNTQTQQIKDLTEQNDELENYFRSTIIPQLFIDANLILQKYTPAAKKQFDLAADDIGKPINDVIISHRFPSIIENIQRVIDKREILEKEIQTTDLKWFQLNILPFVKQIDNTTNGVIVTFVDISVRIKDLKEQVRLVADHETLLDTISHDLKNPLTNLLLAVELLNNESSETESENQNKPLLRTIENGIKKLNTIINDLIETRKGEHKYKAIDELINFENILEDVRISLLDNIHASGATIKRELNVTEINFSRQKLRSIIYNLINNSIKFKSSERNLEIFIKTIRQDNFIIISIKDNGIGIDKSNQDKIFSKYFRIDDFVEGSGIGLYLVKELVNNTGGKIIFESQIGKGTEFKIYLKEK